MCWCRRHWIRPTSSRLSTWCHSTTAPVALPFPQFKAAFACLTRTDQLISTPLLTKAQTGLVLPQEAGLTGIAFHPDFNHVGTFGYGKFYTITTEASENNDGLPDANVDFPFHNGSNNEEHQDVVREWDLNAFGNVPGNAANNQFTGTQANSRELLRTSIDRGRFTIWSI